MYRRELLAVLLISAVGLINVAQATAFSVFAIPLERIDSVSYCERLDGSLRESRTSMLLLEVGRPGKVYEVVRSVTNKTCDPIASEDRNEIAPEITDNLIQMIHEGQVSVQKHQVVEHLTLHSPAGDFLLTVERTGDLEANDLKVRFGGSSDKDKLLLSLVGGGRIRRVKKP